MNSQQIARIQSSFAQVRPIADAAAELFYGRLFELNPSLRAMFPADITEQKRKLMTTLALVVNGLPRLETLVPAVQALGRRHVTYGVEDKHFETVGATLLWTLEQGLGAAFTPEVKAAWAEAYGILASVMKDAMADERLKARINAEITTQLHTHEATQPVA